MVLHAVGGAQGFAVVARGHRIVVDAGCFLEVGACLRHGGGLDLQHHVGCTEIGVPEVPVVVPFHVCFLLFEKTVDLNGTFLHVGPAYHTSILLSILLVRLYVKEVF